jgi:hypothetical protein
MKAAAMTLETSPEGSERRDSGLVSAIGDFSESVSLAGLPHSESRRKTELLVRQERLSCSETQRDGQMLDPSYRSAEDAMKTHIRSNAETHVAKTVAGDDLRCGDFVTILNETIEFPSFLWGGDCQITAMDEPVRMRLRGDCGGIPLKVKAICLPFVFVKLPRGRHATLDMRQCHLVRLNRSYATSVWKRLRKQKRQKSDCGGGLV